MLDPPQCTYFFYHIIISYHIITIIILKWMPILSDVLLTVQVSRCIYTF